MLLDLTPNGLLATTSSVRKRLDVARPVEREVLEECLRLAQQAPTRGAVLPPRACVRLRYSSGSDSSVLVIAVSRAGW
jgi:nitroreductase